MQKGAFSKFHPKIEKEEKIARVETVQVESRRKGDEGEVGRDEAPFFISSIVGVHNSGAYYGCYSFGGRQLRAAVYTTDSRARWRSCTDTLLRSVSDATSGAIYCLTACSSRTERCRCLFTAVERSTDPFFSFLRLAEGGTITIASDNERASSKSYSLSL